MNKNLINIIMFTAGAAIGSLVTWKVIKTKYERIAQEEIDSVREEYDRLSNMMRKEIDACRKITEAGQNGNDGESALNDEGESSSCEFTEQERVDYSNIASRYRTAGNDDDNKNEGGNEDEVPYINGPYVISQEEFEQSPPGYSLQPLDYFADGILADGWGVELDIEDTIGEEALDHFGDYVDDVVYVRNERNEIDYEVTRDPRTYAEAVKANPYSQHNQ